MSPGTDVLLINPYIHDFAAYNLWMRPAGLIGLYGFLTESGISAEFIDVLFPTPAEAAKYGLGSPEGGKHRTGKFTETRIPKPEPYAKIPKHFRQFGIPEEAFLERLRAIPAPGLIIMTSGMTYWYPGVRETIRLCRRIFPGVRIVLGGVYATLCCDHAERYSGADMVIPGSWVEALGGPLGDVLGGIPVLERGLPSGGFPGETSLYPDSGFGIARLSEGCPLKCSYCASSKLSGAYRRHDVGRLFSEIAAKADRGCSDIAFYDDALLAEAGRGVMPLLRLIVSAGIPCRFHTPNGLHSRLMTREIADLFYAAGFKTVRLSFDRTGLDAGSPKASAKHLERAGRALEEAGYRIDEIKVYTLIGLGGQEDADMLETFRIIKGCGMGIAAAQYAPVPGTGLFEEDCRRIPELESEPLLHNSSVGVLWDYDLDRYERLKKLAGED